MKREIKIDHNRKGLREALLIDSSLMAYQLRNTLDRYCDDDRDKLSVLAECIHDNLDYNAILMFAVSGLKDFVDNALIMKQEEEMATNALESLIKIIKKDDSI
jgi:hypothetical protein